MNVKEAHMPKGSKLSMEVWTRAYRPFIMGGDCNASVKCRLPVDGPYDIGKGFKAYLVTGSDGTTRVAEAVSGGLIGPDLESVRKDVKAATKKVMKQQVKDAVAARDAAISIDEDEMKDIISNLN